MRRRVYLTQVDVATNADNAYNTDEVAEEFDHFYDYPNRADVIEGQRGQVAPDSVFSTPGRASTLVFSVLLLLVVGATVIWLVSTRSPSGVASTGTSSGDISGLVVAPRTGALAPDFELIDVHTNKPVKLSSLRGKPVFINFWGTWCPPCRAEMPEMQKLYDKYKGQVEVVGISMGPRDDPTRVQLFVDVSSYGWTFLHDPDYSVATTYQVQAIPSSYFIDKDGVIRSVHVGGMNGGQMEYNLQQAR